MCHFGNWASERDVRGMRAARCMQSSTPGPLRRPRRVPPSFRPPRLHPPTPPLTPLLHPRSRSARHGAPPADSGGGGTVQSTSARGGGPGGAARRARAQGRRGGRRGRRGAGEGGKRGGEAAPRRRGAGPSCSCCPAPPCPALPRRSHFLRLHTPSMCAAATARDLQSPLTHAHKRPHLRARAGGRGAGAHHPAPAGPRRPGLPAGFLRGLCPRPAACSAGAGRRGAGGKVRPWWGVCTGGG